MRALRYLAVICCVVTWREAAAQSFSYVPPGYGYGDYYGGNLGNGVGFGYGVGIGVQVPSAVLNSSYTDTYVPPFQELCDSNPSFISRDTVTPASMPVPVEVRKKKAKPATSKKIGPKISSTKAKPVKQSAVK